MYVHVDAGQSAARTKPVGKSNAVQIRNVNSSLELLPAKFGGGPNVAMVQESWGSYYRITIDGTGWYTVEDTDGLCLSPAGGSTAKNAPIVDYYCDADPARHWTVSSSYGTYTIRNVKSGMCMSPAGGSAAQETAIVQYYCDGDPSRLWTLVENQLPGKG